MKNKKFRYSLNSKAFIVGAVIIVLLLNAILISLDSKIPLEFDFTKGKIYELSDESNAVIDKIDKPIEILFLTQGTENEELSLIKNILDKYSQRNSNITIREINALKNPVEVQAYIQEYINTYNSALTEGSILIKQGDRYDMVNSADFLNYDQGYSYTERIVTTKLANFVDGITLSSIYLTTGHGENFSDATVRILEMAGYTIKSFDTLSEEFPTDHKSVVMICAPQSDFSVEEISKLDKYLDKGGNVQIYFEPLFDSVSLPNLNGYLADDWGIERQEQRVYDFANLVDMGYMVGEFYDHEITTPIKESQKRGGYGPANSFTVATDKPSSVTVSPLLSTTENAISDNSSGKFDVMMAAKREKTNMENNELITGRLIIGGSSYIVNELPADARFANEDILLNSFNWMNGGDASLSIRPKELPGGVMSMTATEFWTWFSILIVIIPLGTLAAGIVIFVKRRYK